MYEAKFPEVDDVVMVQVKSIAEMGAYVSLMEYAGVEGMILLSELSRRRIRSITKLIKVWQLHTLALKVWYQTSQAVEEKIPPQETLHVLAEGH